jgi:hypothetical protein
VIATARLLLRPLTVADAMSHEAGMRRWIPDQVYRDEAHAAEVVARLIDFAAQAFDPVTRPFVLGIEFEGDLVGHVGLSPLRVAGSRHRE